MTENLWYIQNTLIEFLSSISTMPQELPGVKFAMKRDQTNGFEVQLDINPNVHFILGSMNYDTTKLCASIRWVWQRVRCIYWLCDHGNVDTVENWLQLDPWLMSASNTCSKKAKRWGLIVKKNQKLNAVRQHTLCLLPIVPSVSKKTSSRPWQGLEYIIVRISKLWNTIRYVNV